MKKKNRIIVLYYSLLSLSILSCHGIVLANSQGTNNMSNNPAKYYFEMDTDSQQAFFKKLSLLKIGDSTQKVKTVLGEPTYDQRLVGKKGEFIAHALTYYTRILKKGLVNEKYDRYVVFLFDSGDVLTKIESNIERFEEKIGKKKD